MLSTLEVDRSRLAEIEILLADLERSVSALRAEKLQLQERLDSYKYPVLTLPSEIVSEILTQFVPQYPLYAPFIGPFSPTSLTQVCHKWREIALETSVLWKGISFFNRGSVEMPFKQQIQIANMWFARSRCSPLAIYIEEDYEMPMPEIFAAITPHRARWESLEVLLLVTPLPAFEGPMPQLRRIYLLPGFQIEDQPPAPIATFREAPLLRRAILDKTGLNLDIPWAQLTSLTLNKVHPVEFVPILQQTSQLLREVHITGERTMTYEAYHEAFASIPKFDGEDPNAEGDLDSDSSDAASNADSP
ncbi:hypothetical protein B0H19DRAFT_1061435 [Mycena capillaripes]|nr:hypothetical protein B0H19DRAFT_1061435 [Mycena capillaripes]